MYTFIILVLLAFSVFLIYRGVKNKKTVTAITGVMLAAMTILFFSVLSFYGEVLWFYAVGYSARFWKEIIAKVGLALAGAVLGWLVVSLFSRSIPKNNKANRWLSKALAVLVGFIWGFSNWDVILKYVNKVNTGVVDPILEKETSFYLFSLPFYDSIYTLALMLLFISLISLLAALFVRIQGETMEFGTQQLESGQRKRILDWLYINTAVIIFVLAIDKLLSRYHLLFSTWGVVTGPGWTDVHIRLPGYTISIILTVALGVIVLIPSLRDKARQLISRRKSQTEYGPINTIISFGVLVIVLWLIILTIAPGLVQWLRVEPNEITFERPYIKNNIEFTRKGFALDKVEEREFPATEEFNRTMVENNQNLFENIRLWDYRALDAVYKQFQEIRLYYEFVDVDIDRYTFNKKYKQVMISAREMEIDNLPEQSQTFVNRRFKYTHGNGITLTSVSDFTPEGLPNLLVQDIPPKSTYPSLNVEQPQIYYGELTDNQVYANSKEKEFDYPSGEQNVYTHYNGTGGVELKNLWRKFLFGWKIDGTRFFLSSYPTPETRIMFHRNIRDRVQTLAPFLRFDEDPYIVLADGKLYWILDCYTTSKNFPYSERIGATENIQYRNNNLDRNIHTPVGAQFRGINYIRNSVKAVVDAYNGSVTLYIFDKDDPIIRVWDNIFPDLFVSRDEMPENLFNHVRYPSDFMRIQGMVYTKYHMTDPDVFYNQEDLWVRATEKYYNQVQPVEPYYVMWESPDKDNPEYILMLPFTPKNRQVLIGWIAGMCDGENYGRFLAYKFPKEKRILGPQQVETKIDQDSYLSGQLSLWDQRGSNVIRGNMLAIPIEETIIYVEPIYLQAETAAYPELRLVAVMHGDNLSYAETFDKALQGLFKDVAPELPQAEEGAVSATLDELVRRANQYFNDYLQYSGQKQFNQAASALENLQSTLQQLQNRAQQPSPQQQE